MFDVQGAGPFIGFFWGGKMLGLSFCFLACCCCMPAVAVASRR